ncbi:hypothetical protein [Nocardioides sp. Leaf285]|nr:hypothetical protein [Nocardioides sp. Leaf285]KQP64229.1 hypothetical protein ASF47_09480 [Nocardioides sp. Leaf285]
MRAHTVLRAVAAAVLTAVATGPALVPAPASAASCTGGEGASAVVDFKELGGGIAQLCVPGGGGDSAQEVFEAAGVDLAYVAGQGDFVCTVQGKPAEQTCQRTPPATAYWSLWVSDGTSGSWTYATRGVSGLTVPEGGSVAFAWVDGSGSDQPGVAPARYDEPAGGSGGGAGSGGSGSGGSGGGSAGGGAGGPAPSAPAATPAPSATADPDGPSETTGAAGSDRSARSGDRRPDERARDEDRPGREGRGGRGERDDASASPSPSASGSAEPSGAEVLADAAADSADDADAAADADGLPAWVGLSAVAGLLAVAGVVLAVRRRSAGGPQA